MSFLRLRGHMASVAERQGRSSLDTREAQGQGRELGTRTKPTASCPDSGPQQPLQPDEGDARRKTK